MTLRERVAAWDRENRLAAQIILADIERFGGEGSASVRWARAFRARVESEGSRRRSSRPIPRSKFAPQEQLSK